MAKINKVLLFRISTAALIVLCLCSKVASASTIHDSIRPALRSSSLSEETINELRWEEDYYRLVEELLDSEAEEILRKIDAYHREIDIPKQIEMVEAIARRINEAPFVYEVYGLGFPFYGDVDIRKRVYLTLLDFKSGKIDRKNFLASIVPDIDILLVHKSSDEGPWNMSYDMDTRLTNAFLGQFTFYRAQWGAIFLDITKEYSLVSNRIGFEGVSSIIEGFSNEGKLHVDLVPIPAHIWSNMPVFILPSDLEYFKFIRDLLFTNVLLSQRHTNLPQNLPLLYRRNYLLNLLKSKSFTEEMLLEKVIEMHPYRHYIEFWPNAKEIVKARFKEAIELALAESLFYKGNNGVLNLAERGKSFLESILLKREGILQQGFSIEDIDGDVVPIDIQSMIEWAGSTQNQL